MDRISTLVTHDGKFHADEVTATALLKQLFPYAVILRTRNPEYFQDPKDWRIAYDLGGRYDPDAKIFDHHQKQAPQRPEGEPYSSLGLIWKHYGRRYLETCHSVSQDLLEDLHEKIDQTFILPIDCLDNGVPLLQDAKEVRSITYPMMVESLNPTWDAEIKKKDTRAFFRAVEFASLTLNANIESAHAGLRASKYVEKALEEANGDPILTLPRAMPFKDGLKHQEHVKFVIHPREDDWVTLAVPVDGQDFTNRTDFPQHWAGLRDADLVEASSLKTAKFCHKGCFIFVAGSYEDARAAAEIALEISNENNTDLEL